MTKEEAIKQMMEGKKLSHVYFTPEEWVLSDSTGTTYFFEDGCQCTAFNFWAFRKTEDWETGWNLFN